jgi:fatty acid omega-hydroxylase
VPFFGSTFELMRASSNIDEFFVEGTRKYGEYKHAWGFSAIRAGPAANGAVVAVTPAEVKHILKDKFDCYGKGEATKEIMAELLTGGILLEDGELWKTHRRTAAPLFSQQLMRQGARVAVAQAKVMVEVLSAFATSGEPVDLQPRFQNFTIDAFCEIAFGTKLHTQTNDGSDFAMSFVRPRRRAPESALCCGPTHFGR